MITADEARALWFYDPVSGEMRWKVRRGTKMRAGSLAGTIGHWGYRILSLNGKKYRAGRIAWLIMTGEHPEDEVDHENTKRDDDRWINLRPATRAQQLCNTRTRSDNLLGVKGVSPTPEGYGAFICFQGKRKNLGSYDTIAEAKAVRDAAARAQHGDFARSA